MAGPGADRLDHGALRRLVTILLVVEETGADGNIEVIWPARTA